MPSGNINNRDGKHNFNNNKEKKDNTNDIYDIRSNIKFDKSLNTMVRYIFV